jgi:hypothetical protein
MSGHAGGTSGYTIVLRAGYLVSKASVRCFLFVLCELYLRARLGFDSSPATTTPHDLRRIDACWSVSIGLGTIDTFRVCILCGAGPCSHCEWERPTARALRRIQLPPFGGPEPPYRASNTAGRRSDADAVSAGVDPT